MATILQSQNSDLKRCQLANKFKPKWRNTKCNNYKRKRAEFRIHSKVLCYSLEPRWTFSQSGRPSRKPNRKLERKYLATETTFRKNGCKEELGRARNKLRASWTIVNMAAESSNKAVLAEIVKQVKGRVRTDTRQWVDEQAKRTEVAERRGIWTNRTTSRRNCQEWDSGATNLWEVKRDILATQVEQ